MSFTFKKISPHPLLAPYIEKMWVFESSGKLPSDDMKLVVPNGNIKLTVAYSNEIVASVQGKVFHSKEDSVVLTGLVDAPLTLDVMEDKKAGTIRSFRRFTGVTPKRLENAENHFGKKFYGE